jgi:hypothetical protein
MSSDQLYNNSILEVKKYQLFDESAYKLLDSSNNFLETLNTLGYGVSNSNNIYTLSNEELLKVKDTILSYYDIKSPDVMLLYLDYDISNIRETLKQIKLNYKSNYYSKLGLIEKEELINLFKFVDYPLDSNYKDLFDSLTNEKLSSLEDIINKVNKLSYTFIFNKVYSSLSETGKLYFSNLIDIKNILLVIKCRESNKDIEFYQDNFLDFGNITKEILFANYNLDYQNMFLTNYYGKVHNILSNFKESSDYIKLELDLNDLIIEEIKDDNLLNNVLFQYYLLNKKTVSNVLRMFLYKEKVK